MPKQVTILGATGSIGQQTLQVIALHPDRFRVFALTAQRNAKVLFQQCLMFSPRYAVMVDPQAAQELKDALNDAGSHTEVLCGATALEAVASASEVSLVMAGVVGAAGLPASFAAVRAGKTVLLANKEALVMSGRLFMEQARVSGAQIIPVDSEHNAVFQCWQQTRHGDARWLERLYLTASGGPFLHADPAMLETVTPQQAIKHPTWAMGAKISIDSATLANKALELMEAHYLFDLPWEQLDVLMHPQSIVHALAHYCDGSVLSHMGAHDMRIPISYALGFPDRIASGVGASFLNQAFQLTFEPLRAGQFPCFEWGRQAMQAGAAAMIIFNAANEVAVQAFLNQQIPFLQIATWIGEALQATPVLPITDLTAVTAQDQLTRDYLTRYAERAPSYV